MNGHLDLEAARVYLETLFGTADDGYFAVWIGETQRTRWFSVDEVNAAATFIVAMAERGQNVYLGMGLHPQPLGPHQRGTADGVVAIACCWDDLDIAGPAHTRTTLPASRESVLELLAEFALPYSLLIDSGHGIYPLWLFHEVWVFESPEEHHEAASIVAGVQQAIRTIARAHGYSCETTSDLARVLRPVGSLNRKPNLPAVPVRVLEDTGYRYAIDEIAEVLPDDEPIPSTSRTWTGPDAPRADFARIHAGCAYLRHCQDDAASLDEPTWHAMLSIVARCKDGDRLAHVLSAPYPGYSERETTGKFVHALKQNKPLRCSTIRHERGGERYCATCPHWGRITSPVVLGMPRSIVRVGGRLLLPTPTVPLRARPTITLGREG
jgi:putative DNA primase/helicase